MVVWLVAFASTPAHSGDWDVSGEIGVDVDAIGEEYGFGGVDLQIEPGDVLDDAAETLRFRDENTETSGRLDLRAQNWGRHYFDLRGTLKTNPDRSRGEISLDTGVRQDLVDLWVGERFHAQGGPDDPGGGLVSVTRTGLRWKRLPGPARLKLDASYEVSRAGSDSLTRLFDYEVVRPRLALEWPLGWRGEAVLQGEYAKKTTSPGRSAHERSSIEGSLVHSLGAGGLIDVRLESGARHYVDSDSLTPSYHENLASARFVWPVSSLSLEMLADFDGVSYAIESTLFRDHRRGRLELKVAADPTRWTRRESGIADTLATALQFLEDAVAPAWSVAVGAVGEALVTEEDSASEYAGFGGFLEASRQAIDEAWFDLRLEAGRRNFSRTSGGVLVFEGISLSFASSDYSYASATLLGELPLPYRTSFEVFLQADQEWHEIEGDDFTLWILSASLHWMF